MLDYKIMFPELKKLEKRIDKNNGIVSKEILAIAADTNPDLVDLDIGADELAEDKNLDKMDGKSLLFVKISTNEVSQIIFILILIVL